VEQLALGWEPERRLYTDRSLTAEMRGPLAGRFDDTWVAGDTDFTRAKLALARHLGKLVLTPVMHDGRPVYRVSGNVSVGADTEKCRMQLVARDGLEPPTPAFSGLRTAKVSFPCFNNLSPLTGQKTGL
jgi:hypothetical protein